MCNEELGAHLNFELFIGGVSWRRCSNEALDFTTPADIATEARIRDGDALQISSMSAWVESRPLRGISGVLSRSPLKSELFFYILCQ